MEIHELPALNAVLNTAATIFLVSGWVSIKLRKVAAHLCFMLLSLVVSAGFLTSYVIYHLKAGHVKFHGEGTLVRNFYFVLLTSHVILAVVIVPLVAITVTFAALRKFNRHKAIARYTLPIWLYVSVTGVLVYFMCYVWYP
jgi:uncharacterized membrane protein YozB (DUF420 family)